VTAFLVRRLLASIPIVLGVALLVFSLFHLVGGDPAQVVLGKHASEAQLVQVRHQLGLDRPLPSQFLGYLGEIVTLDFGKSFATGRPIRTMISDGIGASLSVAVPAFVLSVIAAVALSLLAARFRGRAVDRAIVILSVVGMALPALAYVLFGQYVLAYRLGWFPVSGYDSGFLARVPYVAMPALIWFAVSLGYDLRFIRNSILDETQQDYVRTARAKGLREARVYGKHVLRNSMIPILTYVLEQVPFLILGSLLLESFFGIPGLGAMIIDAINNSDFPVVKAAATVIALLYVAANLLIDVLYAIVDPRVEAK